jgi:tryptophanyl-tRNA synthetase
MRPTGRLHLGHFVGALENWVNLQQDYENFHLVADYHALTTDLNTEHLYENTIQMIIDWIAAGIDPEKSPIFRQSRIKEHTELNLIFGMLVTTNRLERNPSLKEQVRTLQLESVTYGHFGYPVLQAADILLYKGELVPVGEDQAPHVEITREIARKFNKTWGNIFPVPRVKLTRFARLPGLDGKNKMSKSLGNTILLSDSPEEIQRKIQTAVTDPLKIRLGDPGRPDICTVFTYHTRFNKEEVPEIREECESGALGCVNCKIRCGKAIANSLASIRERRKKIENSRGYIENVLHDGEKQARIEAERTMSEVRKVMKLG